MKTIICEKPLRPELLREHGEDKLVAHFADIERIAMVGETKWQHGMATFCKPLTKAILQYFDHAQSTEARAWLDKG